MPVEVSGMYTNGYNVCMTIHSNTQIRKVKLALEWAETVKKAVIVRQNIPAQVYRK